MTNDIEILLKELFATHTEYGKVPTSEGELLNKFTDEELSKVFQVFIIAMNLVKEASSEYGD